LKRTFGTNFRIEASLPTRGATREDRNRLSLRAGNRVGFALFILLDDKVGEPEFVWGGLRTTNCGLYESFASAGNFACIMCLPTWNITYIKKGKTMSPNKTPQSLIGNQTGINANAHPLLKWLFIFGGVVAGVMNVLVVKSVIQPEVQYQVLVSVLVLIGVVVGIFYFDSDDLLGIGLRYMIFGTAANSVSGVYKIGDYIAPFFMGFAYYLGPIVLTLIVVYFVKKYILNG
jgi:hypothetical protein